jgi:hypothetical protein
VVWKARNKDTLEYIQYPDHDTQLSTRDGRDITCVMIFPV